MTETTGRATPKQIRDYFGEGSHPVTLGELKALKENGGTDYDQIAVGLGNGTLTY